MFNNNDFSGSKSESINQPQTPRELTLFYGQSLGFTEEDIRANQGGELTTGQKMTILKNGWWAVLLILLIVAYTLSQILPMLIDPAFLGDAIIFTILECGLALFLIGAILLGSLDAKNLLALFEKKVQQKEGVVQLAERIIGYGKSRSTRYYLDIGLDFELQIPHRTYGILKDNLYCRLYFTPRMKCLAGVEVLNPREF